MLQNEMRLKMHQIEKEKISRVKIESRSKNTTVILNGNAFTY